MTGGTHRKANLLTGRFQDLLLDDPCVVAAARYVGAVLAEILTFHLVQF
jgi:hypothetical protein